MALTHLNPRARARFGGLMNRIDWTRFAVWIICPLAAVAAEAALLLAAWRALA